MSGIESSPTTPARTPSAAPLGGGPPLIPESVAAFLTSLVHEQCALIGALAGVIYLLSADRKRGVAVARGAPGFARGEAGYDPLTPGLVARLERLAVDAAPGADGRTDQPVAGKIDAVSVPRGEGRSTGLYEPEAVLPAIAAPLVVDGRTEFVGVLILPRGSERAAEEGLTKLALTASRFEAFLWREQAMQEAEHKLKLREAMELLDASQAAPTAQSMAAVLCDEVKRRFGCARVSVGLTWHHRIKVVAVSDTDEIDHRTPTLAALEAAMDECAWQDAEVARPAPPEAESDPNLRRVNRAHGDLADKFGPASVASLPLRVSGDVVGVLTLERAPNDPLPAGGLALLRLIGEVVGPALWSRRLADRGVLAVLRDRTLEIGHVLVGPRYTAAKLVGLVLLLALVLLAAVPIPAVVPAECEVRATQARVVVPPFIGYLASVRARPADTVEAGQVLATMDTRDLEAELSRARAERAKQEVQRDAALASGETARAKAVGAEIAALDAEIALNASLIEQAQVRAPIAGVIGRGDLEQFVGARVEPTQSLFEVVAPDNRVVLHVDERRIDDVRVGQEGHMSPRALPDRRIPLRVERITPMAELIRGRNVYLVEAELADPASAAFLRPGMSGVARLGHGWTTGLARLTRPLIDELRLRLWW
ncbi:MAG: HlyD family efflux transporter periplasmic adaptor subunit [Phycisphaerae bacterium]|nr:HlyD family efflux transporter periplasmic adaptor subunit [Phycisphaerae bacterium]